MGLGRGVGDLITGLGNRQRQRQLERDANDAALLSSLIGQTDPELFNQVRARVSDQDLMDELFEAEKLEPAVRDRLFAAKIQGDGFGELLQAQGGGSFGRLQAAVDVEGNPVFIRANNRTGEVGAVQGFRPPTAEERASAAGLATTAKEDARTRALDAREKRLQSQRQKIEKDEIDLVERRIGLNQNKAKQDARKAEAIDSLNLANTLLNSDLASIYGKGESLIPDLVRSQEGIDLMRQRDQFVASLQLMQAGKLKGQGTITDSEREILKNSITVLSDPNISPELAAREIQRLIPIYQRVLGGEVSAPAAEQLEFPNIDNMTEAELDAFLAQ